MKLKHLFFSAILAIHFPNIYALSSLAGAAATIPGIGKLLERFINIVDAGLYMAAIGAGFTVVMSLTFKKDENILNGALKWLAVTGLISVVRVGLPKYFGFNI